MLGTALLLVAAAATPCENLASLRLADATITSAVIVPEGPPPARGSGAGSARGAKFASFIPTPTSATASAVPPRARYARAMNAPKL